MRIPIKTVALLLLPVFFAAAPAFAGQSRVIDAAAMQQALAGRADAEQAQRDQVRRVLAQDDVRQMGARMGLTVAQSDAAVATLSGAELTEAAQRASALEAARAGGSPTIVISLTTLLLILIIVILLAN